MRNSGGSQRIKQSYERDLRTLAAPRMPERIRLNPSDLESVRSEGFSFSGKMRQRAQCVP